MKILIDTHAFLWAISAQDKLSDAARDLIEAARNEIFVSTASLWEMAIKISIGKLSFTADYESFIPRQLALHDFTVLAATIQHYAALTNLPYHHKDPFDRLIIVQSQFEQIPVISIDNKFDAYGVKRIW